MSDEKGSADTIGSDSMTLLKSNDTASLADPGN